MCRKISLLKKYIIAEEFRCSVCTDLLETARTIKRCEHNFCKVCIDQVISNGGEIRCPECREPFSRDDVIEPYRIMRRFMSMLQLTCPNQKCTEIMGYDQFLNHQEYCAHAIVTCIQCDQKYEKRMQNDHQENCILFVKWELANARYEAVNLKNDIATLEECVGVQGYSLVVDYKKSLPIGFANVNHNVFICTLKMATATTYDESLWDQNRLCTKFLSNSNKRIYEGIPIWGIHQKLKYSDKVRQYFGLKVELDNSIRSIEADWKIRVSDNLGGKNSSYSLPRNFFEGRVSYIFEKGLEGAGSELGLTENIFQNVTDVCCIFTITKWKINRI